MTNLSAQFWKRIDEARRREGNPKRSVSPESLEAVLKPLSDDEVKQFALEFYQGLVNLNDWKVWGAGYVMGRGMSDDGFHYFRSWILGLGKDAYECALTTPDSLGEFVAKGQENDFDNEELEYIPIEILESRKIEDDPRDAVEDDADDEPEGEEWNEETVTQLFPTLAKRFS